MRYITSKEAKAKSDMFIKQRFDLVQEPLIRGANDIINKSIIKASEKGLFTTSVSLSEDLHKDSIEDICKQWLDRGFSVADSTDNTLYLRWE